MNNKTDLRIIAKDIRKNLDMKAISTFLVSQLREKDYYKTARNVMIFYPKSNEVNTLELLNDNKNIYLPRVNNDHLLVCPYKNGDELRLSDFKVYEPTSNPEPPEMLDLVIVPALMATAEGYRLGYGGGFYDKFLSNFPDIISCVLLPVELIVDSLPLEKYDTKVNCIIHN